MIAAWMLWSAGIGVLFLVAGLAAERLLTLGGRPTRWVWIVAGAATTALSVLRLPAAPPEPAVVPPPGYAPPLLEPLTVTVGRDSMLRSLDDLLVLSWVVLSSLLVVTVLFAFARLVREGRSWQPGSLGHRSVFWSRDTGPTIVGLLRPRVVLPAWVRAMGPSEQELILAHEEEHIRAGDARLRFLMTLPLFVFPWNPALWLQRHRLNLAVELDCDRRVMRRMPGHRHAYGNLLLRVGAGQNGLHRVALVALSEGRSQLERRITRLEEQIPRVRRLQGALLVLGAAAIVALAVLFPRVRGEDAPVSDELVDLMAEPVFTPYTVRPDLVNERTVMQALEAEYPPILRDAGIGGTTNVRFFIDTRGVVQRVLVAETSGHEALDSAALRVARTFRFTPALNLDEIVSVWIAIPITFSTGAAGADGVPDEVREFADSIARERRDDPGGPPADPEARQEASLADGMQQPTFTRYTVRPDLVNQREVQRAALEREYPPVLREAGIGGTVNVRFFIDAEGRVQRTLVARNTGYASLDEAALRVANVFRFTPALNLDEPAPGAPVADTPTATPYTVPPNLTNEEEVQQAIDDEYPALLRDAGIGGTVHVQIFVDVAGVVQNAVVGRSSGHGPLDEAALRAARVMRFTPALDVDEPVPAWIAIPITFIADGGVYRMAEDGISGSP